MERERIITIACSAKIAGVKHELVWRNVVEPRAINGEGKLERAYQMTENIGDHGSEPRRIRIEVASIQMGSFTIAFFRSFG